MDIKVRDIYWAFLHKDNKKFDFPKIKATDMFFGPTGKVIWVGKWSFYQPAYFKRMLEERNIKCVI